MASMMGRSCSYGIHFRSRLPPHPSLFLSRYSASSTLPGLTSCFFLRPSFSPCRNNRLRLVTASPRTTCESRLFIHSLSSQEGNGCSNASAETSMGQRKPKKKDRNQSQLVSSSEEASLPALPKKVTVSASVKKKETSYSETELVFTSGETSSVPSDSTATRNVTRRRKKNDILAMQSAPSVQDHLFGHVSTVDDIFTSDDMPPKRVNRRKKADKIFEEAVSVDQNELERTLILNPTARRKTRRKKESDETCISSENGDPCISHGKHQTNESNVSVSTQRETLLSPTPLMIVSNNSSSQAASLENGFHTDNVLIETSSKKISRTTKGDGFANISSDGVSLTLKVSSLIPSKKSSRKKVSNHGKVLSSKPSESDIYRDDESERTLALTSKVIPLTLEDALSGSVSASESKIKKRKGSPQIDLSMEENILESINSVPEAEARSKFSVKHSKKVSKKKRKDQELLDESASSAVRGLPVNDNIISSMKEEFNPLSEGATEKVKSISLSEDHPLTPKTSEGNESKIRSEAMDAYIPKMSVKSDSKKGNVESEARHTLPSPKREGLDTSFKMMLDISSIGSAKEPQQKKKSLPDLFVEDDFVFSDAMCGPHDDMTYRTRSSKLVELKSTRSWEGELDGKVWPQNVEQDRQKGKELLEDHMSTASTNENSLQIEQKNPGFRGKFFNDSKDRFDVANGSTDKLAKGSLPLRKENFQIQSGMAKHIRKILEKQNDAMPQMYKKLQQNTGNVKVRTHEKFSNQHSKKFSDRKGSSAMHPRRIERTDRFKNIDRYSERSEYLVNSNRAHGMDRKERKQFAVRNILANQASTLSYMQIYGTGFDTGDTVPTVLLFFDRRRFIFNVGEGLLRFCMEHRFKLSKIDHVFLTRVCAETTGGLPGLILTLAELGESGLAAQTWGPSNLQDLGKALRTFVPSAWLEHAHCFGSGNYEVPEHLSPIPLMEDELIKISAVLLYQEDHYFSTENDYVVRSSSEWEQKSRPKYDLPSTVYICELSEVKGKFDPAKALAKGLKPGYKYGKLQKGESVMADDGKTMVHPDDVLGPSSPGPIMFIVDCPSLLYLPSLLSARSIQSFFSGTGKIVNCIVHVSPPSVTHSEEYQCWMKNFREAHHIMAYEQSVSIGKPTLRCSTSTLSKLNFICPQLFPLIWPESNVSESQGFQDEGKKIYVADNLLKFRFRPLANLGLDLSDVPTIFDHSPVQSMEMIKARDISKEIFQNWYKANTSRGISGKKGYMNSEKIPSCLEGISREEMELVFLGTGSSQPSRHRNVTSIYVHLFKYGGILLDCGEGTYAQLKRRYGREGADEVLLGLKLIWISHMHADHFTGLVRVLSARRGLLEKAGLPCEHILVIGPKQLKVFLDAYGAIEDLLLDFLDCSQTTFDVEKYPAHRRRGLISVPAENEQSKSQMQHYWMHPGFHIHQGIDTEGRQKLRKVLSSLGLKEIISVPVVHCPNAFAVVIEADLRNNLEKTERETGWKLVFSGDTRPCRALIEAARGATILIHEATFDDGMLPEAVKKNHSITKEAIEVGVAAEVYRIFLTHFSQRYPAVPVFNNSYNDRTCIAFDMMTVNLADLPVVPQLLPAFKLLFSLQPEDEDVPINM